MTRITQPTSILIHTRLFRNLQLVCGGQWKVHLKRIHAIITIEFQMSSTGWIWCAIQFREWCCHSVEAHQHAKPAEKPIGCSFIRELSQNVFFQVSELLLITKMILTQRIPFGIMVLDSMINFQGVTSMNTVFSLSIHTIRALLHFFFKFILLI